MLPCKTFYHWTDGHNSHTELKWRQQIWPVRGRRLLGRFSSTSCPPTSQGLRDKVTVILSFLYINKSLEETKTNCCDVVQYLHCSACLTQWEAEAVQAVFIVIKKDMSPRHNGIAVTGLWKFLDNNGVLWHYQAITQSSWQHEFIVGFLVFSWN